MTIEMVVIGAMVRMVPSIISRIVPTAPAIPAEWVPAKSEITIEIEMIIVCRIYIDTVSVVIYEPIAYSAAIHQVPIDWAVHCSAGVTETYYACRIAVIIVRTLLV